MSLSTSNSSEQAALPVEGEPRRDRISWLDHERRIAFRVCAIAPPLSLAALPFVANWLLYVIYLTSPEGGFRWSRAFESKPAMAVCLCLAGLPLVWLCMLECERRWELLRRVSLSWAAFPWAALTGLLGAAAFCLVLELPRARWFFVEWAIVRTPNPSFARNTLHWEQRTFEQAYGFCDAGPEVGLIGSSQVYAGFDAQELCKEIAAERVEKDCLAGFGPLQYPMLISRIDERGFNEIVCWISEFDMFRDDEVPTNRLRWAANPAGLCRLWSVLSNGERWQNRASLADIGLASCVPAWRLREDFQRVILGYWWDIGRPKDSEPAPAGTVLAVSGDLEDAKLTLRQNVRRTELVDANFKSFRLFAEHFVKNRVTLVVLEGESHPQVMTVYPAEFRKETRRRLTEMAAEVGFDYVTQEKLPPVDAADFSDGYHLNDRGRGKMTRALGQLLREQSGAEPLSEQSARGRDSAQ